jgi:hypothetical protein
MDRNKDSRMLKLVDRIVTIVLTGIVTYFVSNTLAKNAPPTEITGQLSVDLVVNEMKENQNFQEKVLAEVGAVSKAQDANTPSPSPSPVQQDINIYIDGALVQQNQPAYISDGSVFMDLYDIGKSLNKATRWDGLSNSFYIGTTADEIQYLGADVTAYQATGGYNEYSSKNGGNAESFSMAGEKYYYGCSWHDDAASIYNLNGKYTSISGVLGHIDGDGGYDATLQIFYDGVLNQEISLTADMMPTDITLDVEGVLQLKMMCSGYIYDSYGFGNPVMK